MGIQRALNRFENNELNRVNTAQNRRVASVQSQDLAQDRLLNSLSTFSTKLAEDRLAESKERIKEEVAEAKALAIEEDLQRIENEGLDPIAPEDREEFENDKQLLQHNDAVTKTGARIALDNGSTFDESQKIANLSGWALYAYTAQKAQIAGANYGAWVEGEMVNNDELIVVLDGQQFTPNQAKTLRQKQAAMKALRQQFLIDNELIGVRRELLAEKDGFYAKASASHTSIMSKYRKQDTIERSFKIKQDAIRQFKATKNYNELLTTLLTTVDDEGNALSHADALDEVHNIIEEEMKLDKFQVEDLETLGEQDSGFVDKYGYPISIKDKWPNRYGKLELALTKADKENYENSEQIRKNKFKQDEATLIDAIGELAKTDPDQLTQTYLTEKKAELEAGHIGQKSSLLDNYIKYGAPDAVTLAKQKGEIEDLIRKALLTPAKLRQFDVRHQIEYKQEAELIGKINSKEQKIHTEAIKDLVEFNASVSALESKDPSVGLMVEHMQYKYRQELAKAIEADDPNPSQTAYVIAKDWFEANVNELLTGTGYNVPGMPTVDIRKKQEKSNHIELKRQSNLIKTHGKKIFHPDNIGKLISQEELVEASERYANNGPLGYNYPGEIHMLFRNYGNPKKGIGKFEIMNQVLKASGLPELGEKPPSIERIDTNTTKAQQVSLDTGNPWTSSRVLADIAYTSQTPNIELVPNGEGEAIQQVSVQSGFGFGETAGAYEFLISNPLIASTLGVEKEDLQPEPIGGTGIKWERLGQAITKLITSVDSSTLDTTDLMQRRLRESVVNNEEGIQEGLSGILEALQTTDTSDVLASQTRELTSEDSLNYLSEILVDAAGQSPDTTEIISGQMTEALNQLIDGVIGDPIPLTDDQKNELATATWKYSGDPMDLNNTLRVKY